MDNRAITSVENGKLGGRPLGRENNSTIERKLRLERIKQRVDDATDMLVNAQLSLAKGISFLYRIDKDAKGKNKQPELVVDPYEIEQYLSGNADEDSYYYISTKSPDNQAINSLFDRTHGKAAQSIEIKPGSEKQLEDFTDEELLAAQKIIDSRTKATSNSIIESSVRDETESMGKEISG